MRHSASTPAKLIVISAPAGKDAFAFAVLASMVLGATDLWVSVDTQLAAGLETEASDCGATVWTLLAYHGLHRVITGVLAAFVPARLVYKSLDFADRNFKPSPQASPLRRTGLMVSPSPPSLAPAP